MDYLIFLKTMTFTGGLIALILFYKQRSPSVLGISIAFFLMCSYYLTSPADIEFVKLWGRPLASLNFTVITVDMLVRLRGNNGN